MAKTDTQRAAYEFLFEHFLNGEPFTYKELAEATGWTKPGTLKTYLRKQYRGLIKNVEGGPLRISTSGTYRVTEAFRLVIEWSKFRALVTQVRRPELASHEKSERKVLIYEFLMPLTNETALRISLDSLFFKDPILAKLKGINPTALRQHFPKRSGTSESAHFEEIIQFIETHFVGYSISHVDGRFRAVGIRNYDQVARLQKRAERYLIDETTAVTRFIFPYEGDVELDQIRFLFNELFVASMIELAASENQVWMLEFGAQPSVHIWKQSSSDHD